MQRGCKKGALVKKLNKKGRRQAVYLEFLVPPARFERATCGLEDIPSTAH
nr:MAG TPA: hypothetical protein [Caudoviricetes sp.]